MRRIIGMSGLALASLGVAGLSLAFESTKVLPVGVRSFTIKSLRSSIREKSEANGSMAAISKPLAKDLTFKKVVQGEDHPLKRAQLEGFLLNEGISLDDSLGTFAADMEGQVAVTAPIASYGWSANTTLALAVPYYQAAMGVELGFTPSANAQRFVDRLHAPHYNLTPAAQEAADKINDAVGELNRKLSKNGYHQLKPWQGQGLGDTTLAAKYRFMDGGTLKMATLNGVVLPTGRSRDPDTLNSIPFGKGTYDLFSTLISDQYLGLGFFVNEFARYSYSFASTGSMRMATAEEALEVEKRDVTFKLGDRLETGASLQYEPSSGLVAGLGYLYSQKKADRYGVAKTVHDRAAVVAKLQEASSQQAHHLEAKLGYSGVPAYQRGELPLPFSATLEYKRHLASINTFNNDLFAVDVAIYF